MLPNGVPIQPQLGILPQNMAALNSLLTQLSNAPNHLLALQSNQLALQQLMGIGSQNNTQTLNVVPGQFFNMGQSSNPLNLFQPLSQNMFLPNLQYGMPNAMQNVNQHLSMQISNPPQVPHHNGPPFPNPIMGPDGIRQQINQSQQKLVSSATGANGIGRPAVTGQQLQENNTVTVNPHLHQAKVCPKIPSFACNNARIAIWVIQFRLSWRRTFLIKVFLFTLHKKRVVHFFFFLLCHYSSL